MSGPPLWVERYLEIPFVDRGRTRRGCDCFGLVRLVLSEQLRITLDQYGFVPANAQQEAAEAILRASKDSELWISFPLSEAQNYDVVPLLDNLGEIESHVGLMVSPTHILHTEKLSGPVCLPLTDQAIAYRLPEPVVYRHRNLL